MRPSLQQKGKTLAINEGLVEYEDLQLEDHLSSIYESKNSSVITSVPEWVALSELLHLLEGGNGVLDQTEIRRLNDLTFQFRLKVYPFTSRRSR